jgi:hypothetical protein
VGRAGAGSFLAKLTRSCILPTANLENITLPIQTARHLFARIAREALRRRNPLKLGTH